MKQKSIKIVTLLTFAGLITTFVIYQTNKEKVKVPVSSEDIHKKDHKRENSEAAQSTVSKEKDDSKDATITSVPNEVDLTDTKKSKAISPPPIDAFETNPDEDLKIMYGSKSGIMFTPQQDTSKKQK